MNRYARNCQDDPRPRIYIASVDTCNKQAAAAACCGRQAVKAIGGRAKSTAGDHLRHYTDRYRRRGTQTGRPRKSTALACRTVPPWRPRRRTRRKGRRSSVGGGRNLPLRATCDYTNPDIAGAWTQTGRPQGHRLRRLAARSRLEAKRTRRKGRRSSASWRGEIYAPSGDHLRRYEPVSPARGTQTGRPRRIDMPVCRTAGHGGQKADAGRAAVKVRRWRGNIYYTGGNRGTTRTRYRRLSGTPSASRRTSSCAGVPHGPAMESSEGRRGEKSVC
jgi:hypothetical protein